jgi:single-strand DNA-binding protein
MGCFMNFIEVAGHLGKDPEARFTPSGQKVTTFSVATKTRRNSDGDDTIWWRVTVWGDRFDKMMSYLKKGSAVIVLGELRKPNIYTNKEGQPQVALEITAEIIRFSPFGKSTRSGDENNNGFAQVGGQQSQQQQQQQQPSFNQPMGAGSPNVELAIPEEPPF